MKHLFIFSFDVLNLIYILLRKLRDNKSKIILWASYPTDREVVVFLRPPLLRFISG